MAEKKIKQWGIWAALLIVASTIWRSCHKKAEEFAPILKLAPSYTIYLVSDDAKKLNVGNFSTYQVAQNTSDQVVLSCEKQMGNMFMGYTFKAWIIFDPRTYTGVLRVDDPKSQIPIRTGTVKLTPSNQDKLELTFVYDDKLYESYYGTLIPNWYN